MYGWARLGTKGSAQPLGELEHLTDDNDFLRHGASGRWPPLYRWPLLGRGPSGLGDVSFRPLDAVCLYQPSVDLVRALSPMKGRMWTFKRSSTISTYLGLRVVVASTHAAGGIARRLPRTGVPFDDLAGLPRRSGMPSSARSLLLVRVLSSFVNSPKTLSANARGIAKRAVGAAINCGFPSDMVCAVMGDSACPGVSSVCPTPIC